MGTRDEKIWEAAKKLLNGSDLEAAMEGLPKSDKGLVRSRHLILVSKSLLEVS